MRKNVKKSRKGKAQKNNSQNMLNLKDFARRQLLQVVFTTGLEVVQEMLETDRELICGPRYEHQAQREYTRFGQANGELVLGGRRVTVKRPRVRNVKGGRKSECQLPTWQEFSHEDPLQERALEQMVIGVSTRKYERSLEDVGDEVSSRGTGRSSVSRRFVKGTQKRLNELTQRDLSGESWAALMIDGVHFSDHVVLVALGITEAGRKAILGIWEGATENTAACKALLRNLLDRGLGTDRSLLVVLDGGKGIRRAVKDYFGDRALIQRCRAHKIRNVLEHLPESHKVSVRQSMNQAYHSKDSATAKKLLKNLARKLKTNHPGAAASLEEGLDETLTIMDLGLSKALTKTLSTTNPIENVIGTARRVSKRVRRWRSGMMILRWVSAGVLEAEKGFRRVQGYRDMPKLMAALSDHDATLIESGVDKERAIA